LPPTRGTTEASSAWSRVNWGSASREASRVGSGSGRGCPANERDGEPHREPFVTTRRKIIVYIATSADGYIARPNGDVEWLNRRPDTIDYGMRAFYATIDTILMGRKTYDWGIAYYKKHGLKGRMLDTKLANYVLSRKPPKRAAPGAEFVSEPVKAIAKRLSASTGKHIWMMGGGDLIASFLDAGEIDEFDIHVIPVFIGD